MPALQRGELRTYYKKKYHGPQLGAVCDLHEIWLLLQVLLGIATCGCEAEQSLIFISLVPS